MKTKDKKSNIIIRAKLILLTIMTPLSVVAQNNLEIKDFNKSFTFNNSYNINLETNTNSETITDFTAIAKFDIDENGKGTVEFKTFKSTLVNVNYSQIKTTNGMTYWNFGCTHSEKPVKIQMTLEINPKSNAVQSFVVYNEGNEKAYVFY
ncbi:hypothetical protein H4O20_05605 [Aequorivita sp. 609]|uniref:hypothetical protein n=1 Tax=Aequorivita TaxID=153265 RepID=UPI00161790AE|nr:MULTISPECIES: hypothetical protein [Aequorivita]MBB6680913.1 hypothetical protein [Aequorivita sp. 609]